MTVDFPDNPQEMDVPRTMAARDAASRNDPQLQASRAFRAEDAAAVYILVCIPVNEKPDLPPAPAIRESYYKTHTIPLLIAHAHGELVEQTVNIRPAQPDVLTLKYRVLNATGSPVARYLRFLVVGQIMYQLQFFPKDGTGKMSIGQRAAFFNSIVVAHKKLIN